jgi:GH15 family glucan-1,4-alpha-glucosidase
VANSHRRDGYAPISSYAALGHGRTVALVASDGAIDWLPIPVLDAPPAFAALLDAPHGGEVQLAPALSYSVQRRYRPGTAVLETTYATASGTATVVDSLNRKGDHPLPWTELARVVHARGGGVPMRWRIRPGRRFDSAEPWVHNCGGTVCIELGNQTLALVTDKAGTAVTGPHEVSGEFIATPGHPSLVALVGADHEPVMVPSADEVIRRVDATTEQWRAWQQRFSYDGPHPDAVTRSALTLRLLTIAASGASAAAATTSLPEAIGGDRNYDYRFAWVRDASFALDALSMLGLTEDVHSVLSWLLRAVAQTAPDVHVLYTLAGAPAPGTEQEIATLPGYLGTAPVRAGNSAGGQRQLGNYGHLMDAVSWYVRHGGVLGPAPASLLVGMADRVCDIWRQPDAGMWELSDYRHYTSSKLGCWVALDRAAWLADQDQLPGWHAVRWRAVAAEIRRWIDDHCWSPRKQCYAMHSGTDVLDAAVLLMARTGFCGRDDRRLHASIEAIKSDLAAGGPLLYRYTDMRGAEGAFAACTFWLVEALAHAGQVKEATAVFEQMLGYCNDVGLLSEEIDPATGCFLGNFPQGLSHLALIGAARALAIMRA